MVRGDKELIEEETLVARFLLSKKNQLRTKFSNWLTIGRFGEDEAKQIIAYHRTMPGYQATPLRTLEQVNRMIVFYW